jgi:hypothetical protein
MKENLTISQPGRKQTVVLRQLVERIPACLAGKLAREHDVDTKARGYSPWSHVVALPYAHPAHAPSLNDVCDALGLWSTRLLSCFRYAEPECLRAMRPVAKRRPVAALNRPACARHSKRGRAPCPTKNSTHASL